MVASSITLDHETHVYSVDGKPFDGPSVTQALCRCGLADYSFLDQETRERSMARGTSVHWLCRLFDEGALNTRRLSKAMRPYFKAWRDFRLATGFIPNPYWTERSFVARVGDLEFCGTVDRVGSMPGMTFTTLDIKTGEGEVPDWCRYQLSLYCEATKTINRLGVKLRPDGTYRVKPFPFTTMLHDRAVAIESLRRWRPDAS